MEKVEKNINFDKKIEKKLIKIKNFDNFSQKIQKLFKKYNILLSEKQEKQFYDYYVLLVNENQKFNLTAITDCDEILVKHFLDSCIGEKFFKANSSVCDIGSGAGFPGIPLKIIRPDLKIIMIDSLNKRVNFLNDTTKLLELKDITAIHTRAEDYFQGNNRENFDYTTSRAVASTATLLEYTLPGLKNNGCAVFYKSNNFDDELLNSQNALKILGGKFITSQNFEIEENLRTIAVFQKFTKIDKKYPRSKNLPKTRPL